MATILQVASLMVYMYNSMVADLNITQSGNDVLGLGRRNPGKDDVRFYLHTRECCLSSSPSTSNSKGIRLKNGGDFSAVKSDKKVKVIVHGWFETNEARWCRDLTRVFLKSGQFSVIRVDWFNLARQTYGVSAKNTRYVGEKIADLMMQLNEKRGVPFENIHIIGHSFGAHAAGFAGKKIRKATGSKIGKITGLDVSRLLFEIPPQDENQKLSSGDARVVEVIHTDAGVFGYKSAVGTIDYYPNGGTRIQPGCHKQEAVLFGRKAPPGAGICSHQKSHDFYVQAWKFGGIPAFRCDSFENYKNGSCSSNEISLLGSEDAPVRNGTFYLRIESLG